jgi:hypothetical protein
MGLSRPGLQPLKQRADVRNIGILQETVIHGDILDLSFDTSPTGFENRRGRLQRTIPLIHRKWNPISLTESFKRTGMRVFRLDDIDERLYEAECFDHQPIESARLVLIVESFEDHGLGLFVQHDQPSQLIGLVARNTGSDGPLKLRQNRLEVLRRNYLRQVLCRLMMSHRELVILGRKRRPSFSFHRFMMFVKAELVMSDFGSSLEILPSQRGNNVTDRLQVLSHRQLHARFSRRTQTKRYSPLPMTLDKDSAFGHGMLVLMLGLTHNCQTQQCGQSSYHRCDPDEPHLSLIICPLQT